MTFKYWLGIMDRALSELDDELPDDVTARLDFSPASLDALEAWLLDRYPDVASAHADAEVLTLDGVARYIGETLRRHLGGRWFFDVDRWSHNGLPQIGFEGESPAPICPLALAREALAARTGDTLHTAHRAARAAHETGRPTG